MKERLAPQPTHLALGCFRIRCLTRGSLMTSWEGRYSRMEPAIAQGFWSCFWHAPNHALPFQQCFASRSPMGECSPRSRADFTAALKSWQQMCAVRITPSGRGAVPWVLGEDPHEVGGTGRPLLQNGRGHLTLEVLSRAGTTRFGWSVMAVKKEKWLNQKSNPES